MAIVGMGSGWDRAPWPRRDWDCWTLNSAWRLYNLRQWKAARFAAWFELHSRRYLLKEWNGQRTHFQVLQAQSCPVYVQQRREWPRTRQARTFPRAAIRRAFPRGDYHASSFDWMLAFGILKGYRRIDLWGVGFGPTDAGEPISARACLEYWIGVAEGRGVRVTLHEPTGCFWIYNYQRERTPYHYDDTWRLVEDR